MQKIASSTVKFDSVYWLNSLNDDDIGLSRRCMDDVFDIFRENGITCVNAQINNKNELFITLRNLIEKTSAGEIPVLHFDMHGSAVGLFLKNGDTITWIEMENFLRAINQNTQSNLLIIQTTCFGFHHISSVDIKKCSPFYILLAPEEKITGEFIEKNLLQFYKDLLKNSDLRKCYDEHLKKQMKYYHAEKFFVNLISQYFQQNCKGRGKMQRVERLLTEKKCLDGQFNNEQQMRSFRRKMKKLITVDVRIAFKYFNTFIPEREPSINLHRLCNDIKNNKIPSLE